MKIKDYYYKLRHELNLAKQNKNILKIKTDNDVSIFRKKYQIKIDNEQVTVVLTSCGRFDLLKKTVDSFFEFNTYKIFQFIIIDDTPNVPTIERKKIINELIDPYKSKCDFDIIVNNENMGQIESIDKAYKRVKTKYIFHLEDDWEFYKPFFIEDSLLVLTNFPWIYTVWLRAGNDTNSHTISYYQDLGFSLLDIGFLNLWHGFTWNPGLRRLSDYQKIECYSKYINEAGVGKFYFLNGYRSALINSVGYTRHIGWSESTTKIKNTQKF